MEAMPGRLWLSDRGPYLIRNSSKLDNICNSINGDYDIFDKELLLRFFGERTPGSKDPTHCGMPRSGWIPRSLLDFRSLMVLFAAISPCFPLPFTYLTLD